MTRVEQLREAVSKYATIGRKFLKSIFKPEHMQEKRTYMFETEDGEKHNPFSDVQEGADAESEKEWRYSPDDFR